MTNRNCGRGCQSDWDVRCCCEPNCKEKNTMKQFNKCKQKTNTLHCCLFNDSYTYNLLDKRENEKKQYHRENIKKELGNTRIHEVVDNIYEFLENATYLSIYDVRTAVKAISKKIEISDDECQEIIDMIKEER